MVDPQLLDELAANATAPATLRTVGGWLLRADPRLPFRRSNATLPFGGGATPFDVTARIEVVEDFYARRDLPPRFQIVACPDPADLDDRLAGRGYEVDAPVDIFTADVSETLDALRPIARARVRARDTIDRRWAAAVAEDAIGLRRIEGYSRLLAGMTPRHVVVMVDLDEEPSAIGIGVLERGRLGIFGMTTRPAVRRRGAARAVLRALTQWACEQGAGGLYLQVEVENVAAKALYDSAGFRYSHSYHYRVLL
jgi:ribosomal protein S18 acetylase RimI-like enzyme